MMTLGWNHSDAPPSMPVDDEQGREESPPRITKWQDGERETRRCRMDTYSHKRRDHKDREMKHKRSSYDSRSGIRMFFRTQGATQEAADDDYTDSGLGSNDDRTCVRRYGDNPENSYWKRQPYSTVRQLGKLMDRQPDLVNRHAHYCDKRQRTAHFYRENSQTTDDNDENRTKYYKHRYGPTNSSTSERQQYSKRRQAETWDIDWYCSGSMNAGRKRHGRKKRRRLTSHHDRRQEYRSRGDNSSSMDSYNKPQLIMMRDGSSANSSKSDTTWRRECRNERRSEKNRHWKCRTKSTAKTEMNTQRS